MASNPYFIVSSGGGRISRVQGGEVNELWKSEPLLQEIRLQHLGEAARIIAESD